MYKLVFLGGICFAGVACAVQNHENYSLYLKTKEFVSEVSFSRAPSGCTGWTENSINPPPPPSPSFLDPPCASVDICQQFLPLRPEFPGDWLTLNMGLEGKGWCGGGGGITLFSKSVIVKRTIYHG